MVVLLWCNEVAVMFIVITHSCMPTSFSAAEQLQYTKTSDYRIMAQFDNHLFLLHQLVFKRSHRLSYWPLFNCHTILNMLRINHTGSNVYKYSILQLLGWKVVQVDVALLEKNLAEDKPLPKFLSSYTSMDKLKL